MEIDLVRKVGLRLLLADSDEKFTNAIANFLPALLQKLTSQDRDVLTKVVDVLTFIKKRKLESDAVRIPVQKLVELYTKSALDASKAIQNRQILTFIGLEVSVASKNSTPVPAIDNFVIGLRLLNENPSLPTKECAGEQFSLFLFALNSLAEKLPQPPPVLTETPICAINSWDVADLAVIESKLIDLFLIDLRHHNPRNQLAVTKDDVEFFTNHGSKLGIEYPQVSDVGISAARRSALRLAQSYPEKFRNVLVAAIGDPVLYISREARSLVQKTKEFDAQYLYQFARKGNDALRTAALELIDRHHLYDCLDFDLIISAFSKNDLRLRQAALLLLRDSSKLVTWTDTERFQFCELFKQYIFDDGWPRSQVHSTTQTQLRQQCYELMGAFSDSRTTITFLMQSLDRDSPDMAPSIQKALAQIMGKDDVDVDREKLLDIMQSSSNNRTRYVAVSFAGKLEPSDATTRTICLMGLEQPRNGTDVVMQACRGLTAESALKLPSYKSLLDQVNTSINIKYTSKDTLESVVLYLLVCIIGWAPQSQDWLSDIKIALEFKSSNVETQLRDHMDETMHFGLWLMNLINHKVEFSETVILALRKIILTLDHNERAQFSAQLDMPTLLSLLADEKNPFGLFLAEFLPLLKTQDAHLPAASNKQTLLCNAYWYALHEQIDEATNEQAIATKNIDAIQILAATNCIKPAKDVVDAINASEFALSCVAINASPADREVYLAELLKKVPKTFDDIVANGEAISIVVSGWDSMVLSDRYPYINCRTSGRRLWDLEDAALKSVVIGIQGSQQSRRIACVRLLCLTQYSFYNISERVGVANDIQQCFMNLLSDSDDVTQESAGRGLSILFENCSNSPEMQQKLLSTLLSSFTDDIAAKRNTAGSLTAETQEFEPGMLPSDPRGKGSISTYKDILDLANETGDSSLVYKFMSLSSNSQIWSCRKGIAFSLESIISKSEIGDQIANGSKIGEKLIPKLFRYLYDPIEVTKQAMKHIWSTLVPSINRSNVISRYLPLISIELEDGITDRQWRVRQASCAALADMVSNGNIEGTIEIWRIGFRAVDDIKESVSAAGTDLLKSLSQAMVRSNTSGKSIYLEEIVPFLVKQLGSEASVKFALDTLLKLSETKNFKPYAPSVLVEICQQLSSLEPQAFNYLALNTSQQLVDNARVSELNRSPIMRGLESMVERGAPSTTEMWELLPRLVQTCFGVPSKLGAACLMRLTSMHTFGELNADPDSLLNVASNELWSKNDAVRQSYAAAIGYLCRKLPLSSLIAYINLLREKYVRSDPDDERTRAAIGMALKQLSSNSGDAFSNVASAVLPLVYVAKSAEDESEDFVAVWNSNTGGSASLKLYGPEIIQFSNEVLEISSSRSLKIAAARAVTEILMFAVESTTTLPTSSWESSDSTVRATGDLLLASMTGRSWPGKENIYSAMVTVYLYLQTSDDLTYQIEDRVLTEIQRRNEEYKLAILPYTAKFLNSLVQNGPRNNDAEYTKIIEEKTQEAANEVLDSDNDEMVESFRKVFEALATPALQRLVLDHVLSLSSWKYRQAACSVFSGKEFDDDIWNLLTQACAADEHSEAVRLEWARMANSFKENEQVKMSVSKRLSDEKSSLVLTELKQLQ